MFSFYSYIRAGTIKNPMLSHRIYGGGNWDRTNDLMHVKHTLWPAELYPQALWYYITFESKNQELFQNILEFYDLL